MKLLRTFLLLLFIVSNNILVAQTPVNVHFIDMSGLLVYVLPFYTITILGLGLFIHKLMRPNFPSKWLYICSTVGILGAGLLAFKFKEIRQTQLPSATSSNTDMRDIPPELQAQIRERDKSDATETIANYWIIAIPNFILLGLGLGVDWRNKK